MTTIQASIDIAAPPEAVWRVLMDWGRYPDWNPMLKAITGQPRKGAKIKVSVASPVGTLPIDAVVTQLVPNASITWHSQLPFKGLLDRDHTIEVAATPEGSRLTQTQSFAGALSSPTATLGGGTVRDGFTRMNEALKLRVEAEP